MKDNRFYERRCLVIKSEDLLEFMQEQKDDKSLKLNIEKDTKEIYFFSEGFLVEYNEDDIIDCVSREFNVDINNIFVDGDEYCAAIYFTIRELD